MDDESSLIIVSNREPYSHESTKKGIVCKKNIGGLVSALDSLMIKRGGKWIAWGSGNADFTINNGVVNVPPDNPKYVLKRIRLSKREISNYYYGFSNRVLWPISHYFLEKCNFSPKYWKSYYKVNKKFANAVLEEMDDEMIWIHDYHLALVPKFIRNARDDAKIAFFWHIPWTSWEIFGSLPWRGEIMEGLLNSDLIGFHTDGHVKNFIECVKKEMEDAFINKNVVERRGRKAIVESFPVGIDYEKFSSHSSSKSTIKRGKIIKKKLTAERIILGVDRLDYSKGILNRIKSFERFIEKYPKYRGKVTFLMVASPSRTKIEEYRQMKKEIDEAIGRINGKFQSLDWIPIRYFYRFVPQERLIAYYLIADAALVTPLIDGMNIVSKEYVATNDKDGVLILSEFAGAAEELKEALIVNPYDIEEVADAIKDALEMLPDERKRRSRDLKKRVKKRDIYWWMKNFMRKWRGCYD